jgi:hypothetical protein
MPPALRDERYDDGGGDARDERPAQIPHLQRLNKDAAFGPTRFGRLAIDQAGPCWYAYR